ncbi:MAG: hypothetical protein ACRDXX_13455 [Stackebrandtia sp.]
MSSKRAQYRRILESSLKGDFEEAERLNAEADDIPFSDSAVLVGAAFYLAVRKNFVSDASHDAVKAFVKEAAAEYADAQPQLRPLVIEGLVRAVLGEADLMQGIDAQEAVQTQMPLTYKIVADLRLSGDALSQLLDEAEELATEWASEG